MQPVTSNHVRSEKGVYLPLTIGRRKCLALIDTGSETTLVPHSVVKKVQLSPSDQHLQAANGSEIVIKGEACLRVRIGGLTVQMECVVVEKVTEILIGMDWLTKNVEQLDIRKGKILIAGRRMNLQRAAGMRPSRIRATPGTGPDSRNGKVDEGGGK